MQGSWRLNISAGGCRNDLAMFATNPQFALTVYEAGKTRSENLLLNHLQLAKSSSLNFAQTAIDSYH
jgi:hypothetical protein